jgi:carbonic anhydrase
MKINLESKRVLLCFASFLVACNPAGNEGPAPVVMENHAPLAGEVHWGYEGEEGAEHWADLHTDFALCRDGSQQSPVDLTGAVPIENAGIERRLGQTVLLAEQRASVMDIVDNGHTIQVTNDTAMTIELGGEEYELVQYHFHAPSEHTIDGQHSPLEAHFVHQSAAGELAVLGVLIEEGEHSVVLEPLIAALPAATGETRHLENLNLDMNELRPFPQHYYRYEGSLTTPPCSESVEWLVMAAKRQVSAGQMTALVSHLHHNNRPVQPLGSRFIGLVTTD